MPGVCPPRPATDSYVVDADAPWQSYNWTTHCEADVPRCVRVTCSARVYANASRSNVTSHQVSQGCYRDIAHGLALGGEHFGNAEWTACTAEYANATTSSRVPTTTAATASIRAPATTTPVSNETAPTSYTESGLGSGAIAGIVVGVFFALAFTGLAVERYMCPRTGVKATSDSRYAGQSAPFLRVKLHV